MSMSFQTLLFDYASMMVYTGTTVRELSWRVLNEEWRDVDCSGVLAGRSVEVS